MKTFSSGEVQKITGATKHCLVNWSRDRLLEPQQRNQGRGRRHLYSRSNVFEVALLNQLHNFGLDSVTLGHVLGAMRHLNPDFEALAGKNETWFISLPVVLDKNGAPLKVQLGWGAFSILPLRNDETKLRALSKSYCQVVLSVSRIAGDIKAAVDGVSS